EAISILRETVGAEFGPLKATVETHSTAISTLEGYAAGSFSVVVTVDSLGRRSVAGIALFTDSDDTSSFAVNANNFFMTFPDAAGGDPVPVFTIANVNGAAKVALRGDMLIDGAVIARMIQAGAITAVHISAGSINT